MLGAGRPLGSVRDIQEGYMNDVTVTVSGFVGSNPALHMGKEQEWTSFRVASTRRYRNDKGEWTDGATLWFTVKAWRAAALNVVKSVHKGDPVVVTGRLEVDEWTAPDGQERMGLVITASAVGVDATRGKVEFARTIHHGAGPETPGSGELVAARPGEVDPFAVDGLGDLDAPPPGEYAGTDASGDEDNPGDLTGVGQRELVTA
jgi:single-strand DNA-binding protein